MFSIINFVPIDLEIGGYIDWAYAMYLATKYPIIKHRAFKKKHFFISTNNEYIGQKFLPNTYSHTLMLYKDERHWKVKV